MRFVRLEVEAFQGIERASIELGPGLNVLYGPNDLGKSTLATAIRAALLMLPKSSEARGFVTWFRDLVPRVTLTFVDDAEHTWRVKKEFGEGTRAVAELLHSKDGRTFTLAHRSREVDEKLRALLGWGIPAPGGKGAPRGLPESFLANVLLAAQTDVDAILGASLEKDLDESGKVRLQKALATLAQDPLFKQVLDVAQRECDTYFTATGKVRRAQGSRLVEADELVKRHQRELDELRRELGHARDAEEQVQALNEARSDSMGMVAEREAALKVCRIGRAHALARREATAQLDEAKLRLSEIEAQAAHVRALDEERAQLTRRVAVVEQERDAAQIACERADLLVREAEEAQRAASSEQGEHARLLRAAELNAQVSDLGTQRAQLVSRQEQAQRAVAALKAASGAAAQREAARTHLRSAVAAREAARVDAETAVRERELARSVVAYGRFRVAARAAEEAEECRSRAAAHRQEARAKEADALALEQGVENGAGALAARRAKLPSASQLHALEEMKRALELAEAALGGGLTVAVRPRRALVVEATLDDAASSAAASSSSERRFEAERSARLRIDDLVDVEVTAGAPDKRRAVEQLRVRWQEIGVPALARAAVGSVAELSAAVSAGTAEERELLAQREQAARMRLDAGALVEKAQMLEQQAARGMQTPEELASLKAAIGEGELEAVEARWTKLGKSWEPEAQRAQASAERALEVAQERLQRCAQEHELALYKVSECERVVTDHERERDGQLAALSVKEPSALLDELAATLELITEQTSHAEAALRTLAEEASHERARAEGALKSAETQRKAARDGYAAAQRALQEVQAAQNTKSGEHLAQQALLARMNQPAAVADVTQKTTALAALPSEPLASEADVQAAEAELHRATRALAEQTEALHKAEGALMKVGGMQLREQVQQIEEALVAARAREHELDVDAKAWKLLRDTLRQAENTEGAHLGRALGGPVGERFVELTRGRYGKLRFDQRLCAEGLEATGAVESGDVLRALSVGTRDQLATLVRLTIASQLKSAMILDDHLVHTDPQRLGWFRQALMQTALDAQVLVFTCRPEDYLTRDELPVGGAVRDLAGGTIRAIDLGQAIHQWDSRGSTVAKDGASDEASA